MLYWIVALTLAAALAGGLAFGGIAAGVAALAQTAFPALLLLLLGTLLFAAFWRG